MTLQGIETDVLFFAIFAGPFLAALAWRYHHELRLLFQRKDHSDPAYWGAYGTSQR